MGKLFSGSQKTTTKNEPWKPQSDALKGIFSSAGDIYNQQKGTDFYQGPLYAGMNDMTRGGIDATGQFVTNTANPMIGQGTAGMFQGAGMVNPAMSDMYSTATGDMVGEDLATAARYASDPNMQGVIDAANRDTARSLYEEQLPDLNRNASASGNMNSTRAGVMEGVMRRGADDRMADTSAAIRSGAFNSGLDASRANRMDRMNAMGDIGRMGMSAFGAGLSGSNAQLDNLDAMIRAGMIDQTDRQGMADADFARWEGQDTRQNDLLSRYYGILGANDWGGTQETKTKSSGNILGKVAGLASVAGGLGAFGAKGLGGLFKKRGT